MPARTVIVVGAGPAGMMAAIRAAQCGAQVELFEKKSAPGNKLLLTGKGRCNLTNACPIEDFPSRFFSNGLFLRDAFSAFSNLDLMSFFESRGVPLKVERQERVFPKSDRSASILHACRVELERRGVKVHLRRPVKAIAVAAGTVRGVVCADGYQSDAQRVVLATGGVSYSFTGSTGEGIAMATELGHALEPLLPGLVGIKTRPEFPELEGLTLKPVALTFLKDGKKKQTTEVGEMLFTAGGVSGPLVVSFSGTVAEWLAQGARVEVSVNLKPGLTLEQIEARVMREFQSGPKRTLITVLRTLLPQRMVPVFLARIKADPEVRVSHIPAMVRRALIEGLRAFSFEVRACGSIEEAMVTRGGVKVRDIDPRTMQSRVVRGLFFTGEMIDVDGDTGGFNLQAAFSTGYLAGEKAAML